MKKFYMFIFVFIVSLFIPKFVFAQQLVTTNSAIGVALYEQIRNEGYELSVPYENNVVFDHVMEPLVDAVLSTYEGVADTFFYVGERLYYDVSKVSQWVKSLFGSGDSGSFVPGGDSGSFSLDKAQYLSSLDSFKNYWGLSQVNYDLLTNLLDYPLSTYKYVNSEVLFIPYCRNIGTPVSAINLTRTYRFENGQYSIYYDIKPNEIFTYKISNAGEWQTFNARGYSLDFISYTPNKGIAQTIGLSQWIITTNLTDLNQAISYADNYVFSCNKRNFVFYINNYTPTIPKFEINRTSQPNPNLQPYMPVNYNYVINNWGSADTIYNETNNNGGSGSVDFEPILEAIQNVDESVIQGTEAIIEAINNLSFDKDIDINIPYDIDINSSIGSLTSLPGIFENVSSGDLSLIHDDSESKAVFSGIFNGLPIEITTLFVTVFILLVVVGVINRLLG